VTVDNISPTLALTHPYEGDGYEAGYDEWINVNAEVQDYSIARVEFYVDNQADPFAVRTVAPFNVNWPMGGVGKHSFHVIAVDEAGNKSKSDPVSIFVVPREEDE